MRSSLLLSSLLLFLLVSCGDSGASDLLNEARALEKAKPAEALALYEQLVREFPKSDEAPDAMYQTAVLYYNIQKDALKAATTYELVCDTYPVSPFGHKALFAAGFTYENELQNTERAKQAYERYIKEYPDSSMAATVRFSLEHLGQTPDEILENLQKNAPPAPEEEKH